MNKWRWQMGRATGKWRSKSQVVVERRKGNEAEKLKGIRKGRCS